MPHQVLVHNSTVLFGMPQHVRTRTHHTHTAHPYIKELRQLIDARAAHKSTNSSDAAIPSGSLHLVTALIDHHAAELITPEGLIVLAGALLYKKYWSFAGELNDDCQQRREPRHHQQNDYSTEYNIKQALADDIPGLQQGL